MQTVGESSNEPLSVRQPSTTTISSAIEFRSGCIRQCPQVYDFSVTAVVTTPRVTDGGGARTDQAAMRGLLQQLAAILGHRMLWYPEDVAELHRPVLWPAGVGGPRLPLQHWRIRPTAGNVAMWIAGWLGDRLEVWDPNTALVAVELREAPHLAAIVRGVDIEDCRGFPGLTYGL